MAAMLRLPRSDGLTFDVPEGPDVCETCRELAPATGSAYCSRLCALFDQALAELRDAYAAADGARSAPAVMLARTRLRVIAAVFDAERLGVGTDDRWALADWRADVEAGELLPVNRRAAIAAVLRRCRLSA